MKPKSKYQKGNPYIPLWLDRLDLNDAQMRVLIHLWRHGNPCFPAGKTIARCLKKSEDTIWRILKKLETKGLIIRSKRKAKGIHNSNEYTLLIPKEPVINKHTTNTLAFAVYETCIQGGIKVHNNKVRLQDAEESRQDSESEAPAPPSDFKFMPDGMIDGSLIALPDNETALEWAMNYYNRNKHSSEMLVGILDENEIPAIVQRWFENLETTGGKLYGSPIVKPRLALEKYIVSAAQKQSNRCKELRKKKPRKSTFDK